MSPASLVGLIIGLVEVLKKLGVPQNLLPVADLIFGILFGIVVYGYSFGFGTIKGILVGLAFGLSACGLFSGIKNVLK